MGRLFSICLVLGNFFFCLEFKFLYFSSKYKYFYKIVFYLLFTRFYWKDKQTNEKKRKRRQLEKKSSASYQAIVKVTILYLLIQSFIKLNFLTWNNIDHSAKALFSYYMQPAWPKMYSSLKPTEILSFKILKKLKMQ